MSIFLNDDGRFPERWLQATGQAHLLSIVKQELVRIHSIRNGAPDDREDVEDCRRFMLGSRDELQRCGKDEVNRRNLSFLEIFIVLSSSLERTS